MDSKALWRAAAVAFVAVFATAARAELTFPGVSEADAPFLSGTVLEETVTPFSFDWVYFGPMGPTVADTPITGTVASRVVRESGTGTLDFYWRIDYDPVDAIRLYNFTLSNFSASSVDAGWRSDLGGDRAPFSATTPTAGSATARFDFFDTGCFCGLVAPGESSTFMFLRTDATQYARTGSFSLLALEPFGDESGESALYATFAPAVPEPSTYALLLAGLGAVAFAARRSRRHA